MCSRLRQSWLLPVLILWGSFFAAGETNASGAGPEPANQQIRKILVVSDDVADYSEGRSRLTNLVEGMGLDYDLVQHDKCSGVKWGDYQLIIVAATSAHEFHVEEQTEGSIIQALRRGTNVLWIGGGIWGTFKTTNLPDAFGLRYVGQGWSSDAGAVQGSFMNLSGESERVSVRRETLFTVEATKASVVEKYFAADGRVLPMPFVSDYRPAAANGHAVYVSLSLLDYWKADEAPDTFARSELLVKLIRRLTGEGTVGKHSAANGKQATLIFRLEDYVPGGSQMAHTDRLWLQRMQRLLELAREHELPVNIALISVYRDPYRGERHDWDENDPGIQTLRRQAREAFADGGSLIVHGYAHQHGVGPRCFSGDDWEVWDAQHQRFLLLDEQEGITDHAFAATRRDWGGVPTIWETPHYVGNADTSRAAKGSGFRYMTESDTKLFPNRDGYLNRMQGLLLNIPETAFNYPKDPDEIRRSGLIRQQCMLPRLVRMNALVYLFYHNMSTHQERALENLLTVEDRYDLWKPNLEAYGAFWEQRERVRLTSWVDASAGRMTADVKDSFEGFTLSVRLPDGMAPSRVAINNQVVKAKARQVDGIWFVYPVVPPGPSSRVTVDYQPEPLP